MVVTNMSEIKQMLLFVVGTPGAGKTSLCEMIAKQTVFRHISVGDEIRRIADTPTDRRSIMMRNHLENPTTFLPDIVTCEMVQELVNREGGVYFVVDGFPCTLSQFLMWENDFANRFAPCPRVIQLTVNTYTAISRLLKRARAGESFGCCGVRLALFEKVTKPLLIYLNKARYVIALDGVRPILESLNWAKKCTETVLSYPITDDTPSEKLPLMPELSVAKMGYDQRLLSFYTPVRWPLKNPPPHRLASTGFYYMGVKDVVKCAYCANELVDWKETDSPLIEHRRWFPACPMNPASLDMVSGSTILPTSFLVHRKMDPRAIFPVKATFGSAGYDLSSMRRYYIRSRDRMLIDTGLQITFPVGTYGRVAGCSELALKSGIDVLGGVIDPDYTGRIGVVLGNLGKKCFIVQPGTRIARLIVERKADVELFEVEVGVCKMDPPAEAIDGSSICKVEPPEEMFGRVNECKVEPPEVVFGNAGVFESIAE